MAPNRGRDEGWLSSTRPIFQLLSNLRAPPGLIVRLRLLHVSRGVQRLSERCAARVFRPSLCDKPPCYTLQRDFMTVSPAITLHLDLPDFHVML